MSIILQKFYDNTCKNYFVPDSEMNPEVGTAIMDLLGDRKHVLLRGEIGYYIYPTAGLKYRTPQTYKRQLEYLQNFRFYNGVGVSLDEYQRNGMLADAIEDVLGYSFYLFCRGNLQVLGMRFSENGNLFFQEYLDENGLISKEYVEDSGEMFVSDIKEHYDEFGLPRRFAECLPEYCESCGAPLVIRETLTGLHCSNPRCVDKIVKRIEMLCDDLNILYFGESTIQKFVEDYHITNPMQIFALERGMLVSSDTSPEVSAKIINQIVEKRTFLLWEYVMYSNMPYIKTSARKIFQGYASLDEAYQDIENGGIEFIQDKLGIADNQVSVQAMKVYKSLMEYKEDLYDTLENVEIINSASIKEINVVCSDEVGGAFKKKAEFYDYVKKNYGEKAHFNFLPSVTKSIDYLVWKGADGSPARYTSKVKTVDGWNSKGVTSIPIVTASQFLELVEGM